MKVTLRDMNFYTQGEAHNVSRFRLINIKTTDSMQLAAATALSSRHY